MQFQVPQFIEVEDKIFGPLTFKQFLYVVGGCGIGYIIWSVSSQFVGNIIGIILALPFLALFGALAFYKIHKKEPFIQTVENAFRYFFGKKLFIWRKEQRVVKRQERESDVRGDSKTAGQVVPKMNGSKLKELSWGLDVNEKINQ